MRFQDFSSLSVSIRLCLAWGGSLLIALSFGLLFYVTASGLGYTVGPAWWLSLATAFFVSSYLGMKSLGVYTAKRWSAGILLLAAYSALGLWAGGRILDWGGDSRTDHWLAVYNLLLGWNPILDPTFSAFNLAHATDYALDLRALGDQDYIGYASKGAYFLAAIFQSPFTNPECGKLINYLALLASLLISFGVIASLEAPRRLKWLGALAIGLAPTILFQLATLYVDQYLAAFFSTSALLAVLLLQKKYQIRFLSLSFIASLSLLIASKQNALIYASLLSFFCCLHLLIKNHQWKPFSVHAIAMLFGTLVTGFNPYVTNTYHYGSPFYPVGNVKAADDIIAVVRPPYYQNKTKLETLFISSLVKPEFDTLGEPDLRRGGAGPLYGLPFLIALILLPFFLRKGFKEHPEYLPLFATVFFSAAIMPEIYWARWVPQIYFITAWILFAVALDSKKSWNRLATVGLIILILNSVIIGIGHLSINYRRSTAYLSSLSELKPEVHYRMYFGGSYLDQWRLQGRGFHVRSMTADELARCPSNWEIYSKAAVKICGP